MTTAQELVPIPQPKPKPLVGNLPELDADKGVLRFVEMAAEHGPIFRLQLPGRSLIIVQSQELVDELCDEERFDKSLSSALVNVRDFAGDGLFTAWTEEPNWQAAHRILMPAFGPAALRTMFDGMADIAEQLLLKWERQGPEHRVDIADDTTRLTLDTIALCSFSHRFNSFYAERLNPFVESMVRGLVEAGARPRRLPGQELLMRGTRKQYAADVELMHQVADQLIADRRRNPLPAGESDILDTMLTAADPKTGRRLPDENVRHQLVTFLIAGHETTSGLLTFTLHELLRHPEVLATARSEVDRVLGDEVPRFEHLSGLGYLDQILKESLRLWPTAPAFGVSPRADGTVLGGRYEVNRDDELLVVVPGLHRDPAVWGADAETFDPDRFTFERAEALPPNAWKPFGNGQRSCIGRGFALQEATLFLAMLLQRFDITAADPDYQLKIKQTLTIKPEGLHMHVHRRDRRIVHGGVPAERSAPEVARAEPNGVPVRVFYGSNSGTAQSFAQRIANDATARGCTGELAELDAAAGDLGPDGVAVIVTASYEGQPPDNAREFVRWLREQPDGSLDGVRYAVFGCGNTDWARTYQAVPAEVDEQLARTGAKRLLPRGRADARGDFFGDFDDWYAGFWAPVAAEFELGDAAPATGPRLTAEHVGAVRDPIVRANDLKWGTVVANRLLSSPDVGAKHHVEIALPEGVRYRAGDYLAVLPVNPPAVVARALSRFELAHDDQVVLRGEGTSLPTGAHVAAGELLGSYVELGRPATRRQLEELAGATVCPPDAQALRALAADPAVHAEQVLRPGVTVLELLERYPACRLDFGAFLALLSPLTPRQYSISSSPRWNPEHATLTVAVLNEPARSGAGTYEGAASNHLAQALPGSKVAVTVRPSNVAFHPPELDVPLVLVCAGSGIAPFRGFLQDRALAAAEQGVRPAPALLFFGCHGPESDQLYRDELAEWAAAGVVDVRPAYSAEPDGGVRYVQDRLWADRAEVAELVERGATVFVCGDGQRMAPAVHRTCARIYAEVTGADEEQAAEWMTAMERDRARYVADVFG